MGCFPGRLVLLVEDDREGRQQFAVWLEQAGFQVAATHNGLQALERAVDIRPDVVVTDLYLPGIDGYELTRRLRSDARTQHIPVIAVTGYAPYAQDPDRADRAGCDVFLSKPCTSEELEHAVCSVLDGLRHPRSA